jgi:hypothetical protein
LSLIGFSAFALVSAMKGLSGETSCGCFGTVTVNPWLTMGLDLGIVICLMVFREPLRFRWALSSADRKKVLAVLIAWFILAGLALSAMLSLKQQPHATLGTEFTGADGREMILLEPKTWIGKEIPLISRFARPHEGAMLKRGEWYILLIHTDCPDCKQMMADLEREKTKRVAFVVVPSRANETAPNTSFPVFWLDDQNGWFVSTPFVVKVSEGICITAGNKVEE